MGFLFGGNTQSTEIECRICRKLNAAKFSYCTKCGTPLNQPPSLGQLIRSILLAPFHLLFGTYEPPPPYKRCDKCPDHIFVPEARFCGYCGKKLTPIRDEPISLTQLFKMAIGGAIGFGVGYLAAPCLLSTPAEAEMYVKCIIGFVGILFAVVIAQDPGIPGQILKRILFAVAAAVAIWFINLLNHTK